VATGDLIAVRPWTPPLARLRRVVRVVARELGPVARIGLPALLRHPVWTSAAAEGNGLGVVVVPGFGGVDRDLAVLRRWLERRGYRPAGAGLGMNLGCTAELVGRLERRIEEHARATGGPVIVLGHSRGGMLGRLVAVGRPDLVRGLVMLGSPVLDPLDVRGVATRVCRLLLRLSAVGVRGLLNRDCLTGSCGETAAAGLAAPLPMPALAIYSQDDGVVGWQSCRDPAAEWVEVRSSHTGMGIDPELYVQLAPRLAGWAARRPDEQADGERTS
jgi:pimeloyl-ACP methyl ester carboxylesterase